MFGAMPNGGMMRNGVMGGVNWMWIPALLLVVVGILLVWVIFIQKK